VRIIFPNLDVFLALKDDPVYKERMAMDHLKFADRKMKTRYAPSSNIPPKPIPLPIGPATPNSLFETLNFSNANILHSINLGYIHEIVRDGKVLPVDDPALIGCQLNNATIGSDGNFNQSIQEQAEKHQNGQ
jgi:EthD domain